MPGRTRLAMSQRIRDASRVEKSLTGKYWFFPRRSLNRLQSSTDDVKQHNKKMDRGITAPDNCICATRRSKLTREPNLTAKCDDIDFGAGSCGCTGCERELHSFVTDFLQSTLELQEDLMLNWRECTKHRTEARRLGQHWWKWGWTSSGDVEVDKRDYGITAKLHVKTNVFINRWAPVIAYFGWPPWRPTLIILLSICRLPVLRTCVKKHCMKCSSYSVFVKSLKIYNFFHILVCLFSLILILHGCLIGFSAKLL